MRRPLDIQKLLVLTGLLAPAACSPHVVGTQVPADAGCDTAAAALCSKAASCGTTAGEVCFAANAWNICPIASTCVHVLTKDCESPPSQGFRVIPDPPGCVAALADAACPLELPDACGTCNGTSTDPNDLCYMP
jgi:hypothetical protein